MPEVQKVDGTGMREMKKTYTPFSGVGNFTTLDNLILDFIMPQCDNGEWKIVCAVIRKTVGWHKETDKISLSQLIAQTGMSRHAVIDATRRAVESRLIVREPSGDTFTYSLNKSYEITIDDGSAESALGGSAESALEVVQKVHPQKIVKEIKNTSAEKIRAVCNASPAWAIAHGETPTQITDEQRERDSINQFPQQYRGFAEAYILGTKRLATKNEIGRWSKAFSEMSERGVTPEILTATIREMRNKGLTNTWPGSCTNMAAAKAAGRKRVEVETPEPLEDIFARPAFIPETRWRKATQ